MFKRLIFLVVIADLFVSINLNCNYSCFANYSPAKLNTDLTNFPNGFPIPYNEKIGEVTDNSMAFYPLWRNLGNFEKRISFDAFTSLVFDNYNFLADQQPELRDSILANQLLYFSDKMFRLDSLTSGHAVSSKDIFVSSEVYWSKKNIPMELSAKNKIIIEKFTPNSIQAFVENEHTVILTLLQEFYTGWSLFVDGKKSEIFKSNSLYISTILQPGTHKVEFKYTNNIILICAIVTALVLCFLLFFLLKSYFTQRSIDTVPIAITILLFMAAILLFGIRSTLASGINSPKTDFINRLTETVEQYPKGSVLIIINTDIQVQSLGQKYTAKCLRFKLEDGPEEIISAIKDRPEAFLVFANFNAYLPAGINYYIKQYYPCMLKEEKIANSGISVFSNKNNCNSKQTYYKVFNNFENPLNLWNAKNNLDSSLAFSGNFCYKLDSIAIYGPTYKTTLQELKINSRNNLLIDISVYVYLKQGAEPLIVYDLQSKHGERTWKGYTIRKHNNLNDKWFKVRTSFVIPKSFSKEDEIKVFVWNNSKSDCYIDNLEIVFDTL